MNPFKLLKVHIKNLDLYGHPVELNFNKDGNTHKTILGGFVSIFVLAMYYYYIGINVKKMLFRENDTVMFNINQVDESEVKTLSINETEIITFFMLSK